ncbi:hypothetical protein IMF27_00855 [Pseudomonas sp. PCH199]|uniref:hypothetical protein n=1 Tax=unclassified Pseudomonas TaxID=196821 RepID=UPI000BCA3A2E|nr:MULTISPECIES: hypothetical protein [unclassified Pseudomonas]MCW8274412.1 hypothetical protein [Pseudomonas sp. PCH199]PAM85086.1 hypothetical protein CES87_00870 [Pseudomonas sp. ERMR1:02]
MSIKTKDWTAQIDRMPGAASFRTYGTVTVAHAGVTPKLEYMKLQDRSFNIRLELKLETSKEVSLQVVTEKPVEYKVMGNSNVTGVSIFYEGDLLHHIDNIMITE